MPVYTILHVSDSPRTWQSQQGGPMRAWKLSLKDPSGMESTNVEWSRKESSPAPVVGESVEGEIETRTVDTRNGPMQVRKFKKAHQGGGGGGYYKPKDPAEIAAIQRQSAQHRAVLFLQAKAIAGAVTAENFPSMDAFRQAVDWFERDIANHAQPYAQPRVNDQQRTGQSDIPEPANGDFEHPPAGSVADLPMG